MKAIPKQLFLLGIWGAIIFTGISFKSAENKINPSAKSQDQQNNFIHYFPDTGLAELVSLSLNKKITDNVTVAELSKIRGLFDVQPGDISNLEGIGYLMGIDSFECSKNAVKEIPAEIGRLINLTYL